jgi:hypothetical protein
VQMPPRRRASMKTPTRDNVKTRKRRPETTGELVGVRLQPEAMQYRAQEADLPSRPEAIRRLIDLGLALNPSARASDPGPMPSSVRKRRPLK